jgi:hypothetical protein
MSDKVVLQGTVVPYPMGVWPVGHDDSSNEAIRQAPTGDEASAVPFLYFQPVAEAAMWVVFVEPGL